MSLPLHLTERARAEALQRHLNDALKEKGEMRGQLIKARHQLEVELRNAVTLRQKLATMNAKERENKQRQDCLIVTSTEEEQLREELAQTRQELLREMESARRQEEKEKSLRQTLALQREKNETLIQDAKRAEGMPILEKRVQRLMLVVKKQSDLIELLKHKSNM